MVFLGLIINLLLENNLNSIEKNPIIHIETKTKWLILAYLQI